MKGKRIPLKQGDWIILMAVILLAAGIAAFSFFQNKDSESQYCMIRHKNEVVQTISLDGSEDQTIEIEGKYTNSVEVSGGKARFVSSDCPNQICVHTGWISRNRQVAVCLPNDVIIEIVSDQPAEVDAVS